MKNIFKVMIMFFTFSVLSIYAFSSDLSLFSKPIKNDNINNFKSIQTNNNIDVRLLKNNNTGNTLLHKAIKENATKVASYLLDSGIDINQRNNEGATPLYYAVESENLNIVKEILKRNKKSVNTFANTFSPIHRAVVSDNVKILKELILNGADIELTRTSDLLVLPTPLVLAVRNQNNMAAKYLLDNEIKKAKLFYPDEMWSYNPFHKACDIGNYEFVKFCIDQKYDVNGLSKEKWTGLFAATLGLQYKIMILLLKNNATVNIQDDVGNTPIYYAAVNWHDFKAISLLLKYNADLNLVNKKDWTLLDALLAQKEDTLLDIKKEKYRIKGQKENDFNRLKKINKTTIVLKGLGAKTASELKDNPKP